MSGYIDYYDQAPKWVRIVFSALGIPAFLYRLFKVIIEKAGDTSKLIYLILNVIPFIGTVIWVIDIVWCILDRKLPLCFADLSAPETVYQKAPEEPKEGE